MVGYVHAMLLRIAEAVEKKTGNSVFQSGATVCYKDVAVQNNPHGQETLLLANLTGKIQWQDSQKLLLITHEEMTSHG